MADLESKLRPLAESLVGPDEELLGTCIATQQTTFKGWMVAIAVTEERLILQKLNRRFEADGDPLSLTAADIAEAEAGGGGGLGISPGALILDGVATELKLKTTGGEKLKLRMMDGDGPMGIGGLGGGTVQRQGMTALGEWFERALG